MINSAVLRLVVIRAGQQYKENDNINLAFVNMNCIIFLSLRAKSILSFDIMFDLHDRISLFID